MALNQQSQGVCYDLNAAKFKQNGNCGYVLKPAVLCDNTVSFNPQCINTQFVPGNTPQLVQIKVRAQCLSDALPSFISCLRLLVNSDYCINR